jgi:hypothetical protein
LEGGGGGGGRGAIVTGSNLAVCSWVYEIRISPTTVVVALGVGRRTY